MRIKEEKNDLQNYKSKLNSERKEFRDWLGSCTRYLMNKRIKNIKYQGYKDIRMRLIDADELIKRFSNSKCGKTLKTMVDTQPTAYDIDKVVEELEEKVGCEGHCSDKGAYCGIGNCRWSITDIVIDIVKKGVR